MNKKILTLVIPFGLILTSCNYNNTLYGKTYTYKNDCAYGIENKSSSSNNKSISDLIKDGITNNYIDWTNTGFIGSYYFFVYTTPFLENGGTYDEMISSMKSKSIEAFDKIYKDFKLVINDYKTKTATITFNNETKTYTLKGYKEDTEDATTLYMYENDTNKGYISCPTYTGAGVSNGVWKCIEVNYDNYINRTECQVTFTKDVTWNGKSTKSISWYVYAKISN